ncbi:BgTH12-03652 [Blumeria graminis f. sp. triticale]|uniref:Bgt-5507 n=3 Tax=Blumeria graminis TaxID=34373 RepID=A0A061HG16_BLUGR|nr:hypothetical protein BGT96224_5507 [Blumeria graminis f. sp. tritici 96224]CAD6499541.1 BgTH12-03652 [Blumeria graminis f. sp. triticale]VCU39708.1 Bgt-5507 [Blumeria graminis f. sp. tritici]
MIPSHTARAFRHGFTGISALSPDFTFRLALSTRAYHEAAGPSTPAPCPSLRLRVEPSVIATNRPGQDVLAPFVRARRDGDGRIFEPAMMRPDLFHRNEKSPARGYTVFTLFIRPLAGLIISIASLKPSRLMLTQILSFPTLMLATHRARTLSSSNT